MKRIRLIAIPLITISFLASCASANPKHEYFVSFETYGADVHIPSQRVTEGKTVNKPDNPKRGYDVFLDWYLDADYKGEPYTFTEPVNKDITLFAKWSDPTESCHFKFIGTDCKISDKTTYETDLPIGSSTQFWIVPSQGYLPVTDEDGFKVVTGEEYVSYDELTGAITISEIAGNVEIVAKSHQGYTFEFTGINCKINGENHIKKTGIQKGTKNIQYTLIPDEGYSLPTSTDISITGDAKYERGIITINQMNGDVKIEASSAGKMFYQIAFSGVNCRAGLKETADDADYLFMTTRSVAKDSLILHLFPDEELSLPDSIQVQFDEQIGVPGTDYLYNKDNKTIEIIKKGNALVSLVINPEASYYTITFDAGAGSFGTQKTLKLLVDKQTVPDRYKLYLYIRALPYHPLLDDHIFGYYTLLNGGSPTAIKYTDPLASDVILKAQYFEFTEPQEDLNHLDWSIIKQVAVTNNHPENCFKLGAYKNIQLDDAQDNTEHQIRIIGFNQDVLSFTTSDDIYPVGITFEFANLISNDAIIKKQWNDTDNKDFTSSALNTFLNNDQEGSVYKMLPDTLQAYMENVQKKVAYNGTDFLKSYSPKLFPLSLEEMDENGGRAAPSEGSRYQYYIQHTDPTDWLKKDITGTTYNYWLRSPDINGTEKAWVVEVASETARMSLVEVNSDNTGVAPAFCI